MLRTPVLIVLAAVTGATLSSTALGASLSLVLSGTAFEGLPSYSVTLDGEEIAAGSVDTAIDTASGTQLSAESLESSGMPVTIDIPETAPAGADLRIALTNDRAGPTGDRNLFILSAALDGEAIALNQLGYVRNGAEITTPVQPLGFVALWSGGDVALVRLPGADRAAPLPDIAETPAVAAATPAQAAAAAATTEPACDIASELAITGFPINSATLPADARRTLDALAEQLRGTPCPVTITGYSSQSGPARWNQQLAETRAQGVAAYLGAAGLADDALTVISGGPTDQFGDRGRDNQRVILEVRPAQ